MLKFPVIYVFLFNIEAYHLSISYYFQLIVLLLFYKLRLYFQIICSRKRKLDTFAKSTFS